jgi:DNA-binding Xre family transcriptional regulator
MLGRDSFETKGVEMAAHKSGKNVRVNAHKIHVKILERYKNVNQFCSLKNIEPVTMSLLISGKQKHLRSENLVLLATALECNLKDLIYSEEESLEILFASA